MSHPPSKPDLAEKLERAAINVHRWAARHGVDDHDQQQEALMSLAELLQALAASHRDRATLDDHQTGVLVGCRAAFERTAPLYTAAQVQERVEAAIQYYKTEAAAARLATKQAVSEAVAKEREAVKAEIAKAYKAANPDPFWNGKDRLGASHAEGQRQALRRLEAVLHLAWNSTPPPQARSRGGEG